MPQITLLGSFSRKEKLVSSFIRDDCRSDGHEMEGNVAFWMGNVENVISNEFY